MPRRWPDQRRTSSIEPWNAFVSAGRLKPRVSCPSVSLCKLEKVLLGETEVWPKTETWTKSSPLTVTEHDCALGSAINAKWTQSEEEEKRFQRGEETMDEREPSVRTTR